MDRTGVVSDWGILAYNNCDSSFIFAENPELIDSPRITQVNTDLSCAYSVSIREARGKILYSAYTKGNNLKKLLILVQ